MKKVTARLSKDLHTEVSIRHVSFTLFNRMDLDDILIKDQKKDTLLAAGALKVRISDWFFLKNNIELKYIGLEDATFYQNRSDSVWNFQFLIDYFSSPKKDTASRHIGLDLKKIDFKNVRYFKQDRWRGENMDVYVGRLLLDADKIDLDKLNFKLHYLEVDKPKFELVQYKGNRPPPPASGSPDSGLYFNAAGMHIELDSLHLMNGTFGLINKMRPHTVVSYFDDRYIQCNHLDIAASKLSFVQDTIRAKMELSTTERSGFTIKHLKSDFKLTPQIMEFKDLDIQTGNSHLENYYAMSFKDFTEDMGSFTDNVHITARFRNAEVSSNDIAYFAPELKDWKKQFKLSGTLQGTVGNFRAHNFLISGNGGMVLRGDMAMKGLPDIEHTVMDFDTLDLHTNYNQLLPIVPRLKEVKNPNLAALGDMHYSGNFHGTVYDFTTRGHLTTALGAAQANLNLTIPEKSEPAYKGTIITKSFDLGTFIEAKALGNVAFNGSFEGSSFALNSMRAGLKGHFDSLEVNHYAYTGIDVNGTFQKKYFTGELKIDDPNATFLSNVEIDLNAEKPRFNVLGDLIGLDMRKTHLTKENMNLTGLFDLNFEGNNIDDFVGSAKLLNVSLMKDSIPLNFDSLTLRASVDSNQYKVLSVENNEFNAKVTGAYSILDLPVTFQSFLNKYYPAFINPPKEVPKNQHFTVEIETGNFDSYINLIDTNLHGFDSVRIRGAVNTDDSGSFYFDARIPEFKYKRFKLRGTHLAGKGDFEKIDFGGRVDKFYLNDSSFFPNSKLLINSRNDHSLVQLTTGSNNTINEINLSATVDNLSDGVRIQFQPSYFVLNDKKWDLEKQGEIVIRKHFASAKNVKFSQGFQELTVETQKGRRDTTNNNLVFNLSKVNIGDITPLFFSSPRLEGLATGSIVMINFFGDFSAFEKLQLEQFRVNGDSVGVVNTTAFYSARNDRISLKADADNKDYHFKADGFYNLKDSVGSPLDLNVHLTDTKINFLNQFLGTLFEHIDGKGTGDIQLKGTFDKIKLLGKAHIDSASLDVIYTRVKYFIDSADFVFNDGSIDFGQFNVRDVYGNRGTVKGKLYHEGFQNMRFDFDMSSPKILVLNTKASDNERFFGKAIANARFTLKGTEDHMQMDIKGSVADSSNISINTNTTAASSDADFIVFKKYGEEVKTEEDHESHLNINMDLSANDLAVINVILDPLTGDVITATGNGRLRIYMPAHGEMTMKGKYVISRGNYNFNFQTFLKKPFQFIEGANNFIEWTGDPYNANLNIDAQYTAHQVSINDLINTQSSVQGQAGLNNIRGYRGDVYVIVELRGHLLKPDIGFKVDFPTGSSVKSDPDFALFINRMQSDENEMLKQVTYLIVFNAFAPYGQAGANSANFASAGVNTISSLVTHELNNLFSHALTKLTGDQGLRFEVGAATYSSASILGQGTNSGRLDRQSVNFKLYQSLANDKILLSFGSNLDFGLGSSAAAMENGSFQFLPDISVQFILTRDRKLRAVIFNRSSLGVASAGSIGRQNRYGVSISYTKDFEKLFAGKKEEFKEVKSRETKMEVRPK
ncbi:translocation/assembly module TamB domain-containing protein [Arachidicoccus terrestris]|uniref:translocation/assembly module TamB domain-containing protein n=1 Tax=Arachidicoccus terrestris TaxID=2875539 RepID=UPI001CC5648E|nr:translocation/assembly module TamB domain-containing protein [Arachidicoccus terrestris]UAY56780.1 translocation/assembly module TamB [Arachidicoccus terrestris]